MTFFILKAKQTLNCLPLKSIGLSASLKKSFDPSSDSGQQKNKYSDGGFPTGISRDRNEAVSQHNSGSE